MNNSYITIIKEKRTALSRKRIPLNQNECTADFRIGVPFEQNLHLSAHKKTIQKSFLVFIPLSPLFIFLSSPFQKAIKKALKEFLPECF